MKTLYKTQVIVPECRRAHILEVIQKNGYDALVKESAFVNEIIWSGISRLFPSQGKREKAAFSRALFLFNMVRRDAEKFKLKKMPKPEKTVYVNSNFVPMKLRGTDLSHAYWRVAYNMGVITEKTYGKGFPKEKGKTLDATFKQVRLAALSTLGAGKNYKVIKNGTFTKEQVKIGDDKDLAKIYTAIRYNCYAHMMRLGEMLGNDFYKYETDCIWYNDSRANVEKVEGYLNKENLLFNHLV